MAKTFEVGVWATYQLYDSYGSTPQDRVKTYLNGAIDTHSQHSIDVNIEGTVIAPEEDSGPSFSAYYPCGGNWTNYDELVWWWRDYFQGCNESEANDCDVLLTNAYGGSGATVQNQYSVAEAAYVKDLPSSYNVAGWSNAYGQMNTVLHEVGHALQDHMYEHYVGKTYTHSGTDYGTPFCSPNYNQICTGNNPDQFDFRGEMRYSECCEDQMIHTG